MSKANLWRTFISNLKLASLDVRCKRCYTFEKGTNPAHETFKWTARYQRKTQFLRPLRCKKFFSRAGVQQDPQLICFLSLGDKVKDKRKTNKKNQSIYFLGRRLCFGIWYLLQECWPEITARAGPKRGQTKRTKQDGTKTNRAQTRGRGS